MTSNSNASTTFNNDPNDAAPTTSSSSSSRTTTSGDTAYSKDGLAMWLNNTPERAEQHFRARLHRTPIFAGYAFIVSMNGVIAYEMDRIEQAQRLLKELERRCLSAASAHPTPTSVTPSPGWFSSVRSRLFGAPAPTPTTRDAAAEQMRHIEEQIILADAFLSSAILTFLTHDITGLMRGSWLLRKAWKIYQSTYAQLYEMFVLVHDASSPDQMPPMPSNYCKSMPRSKSEMTHIGGTTTSSFHHPSDQADAAINQPQPPPLSPQQQKLFIDNRCPSTHSNNNPSSSIPSTYRLHPTTSTQPEALSQCDTSSYQPQQLFIPSRDGEVASSAPRPNRPTHLALQPHSSQTHASSSRFRPTAEPMTCPTNEPSTSFSSQPSFKLSSMNTAEIRRLMGAVSFGYGIFQLSASLLPLSLLRIISFFGFEGNRERGIDCLMHARLSDDMRAPLATLALLWFYTFGSQMLKYEDGYTTNQAAAAANLISESQINYPNSAIFLFFRGRVERMQANSHAAMRAYQRAFNHSAQKELRLLCMHEIAWCQLIQLDFDGAAQRFNELREVSVFSKAFYTYMTAICHGASGRFEQLDTFRDEMFALLGRSKQQRDTHIGAFVQHRLKLFPAKASAGDTSSATTNQFYWKYLVYEVLFLWSALSSASVAELTTIVSDCSAPASKYVEPMMGVQQLILGGTLVSLKQYQAAVNAYRSCIAQRRAEAQHDDYQHVSAYANYELAMLLLQCSTDCSQEAKELLREALTIKGYDLENRLVVHVQKELRKLG